MITAQLKRTALALAAAFGFAMLVNWCVLQLFDQKSAYRAAHSLVGILCLMGYAMTVRRREDQNEPSPARFFALALIPCYLGTVWPDLDIRLLGIGGHRNPIFHSAILYIAIRLAAGGSGPVFRTLTSGFGLGLASHLLWDALDYGDVRWIPGSGADRLWLIGNGLIALLPFRRGRP